MQHCYQRECSLLKTIKCDPATFGEESSNHLDFIHPLRILLQVKESSASEKDFRSLKVDLSRSRQRNAIKYGKSEDQRIIETIQKLMPSVSKVGMDQSMLLKFPLDKSHSLLSSQGQIILLETKSEQPANVSSVMQFEIFFDTLI